MDLSAIQPAPLRRLPTVSVRTGSAREPQFINVGQSSWVDGEGQPDGLCALSLSLAEWDVVVEQVVEQDFEGDRFLTRVDEVDNAIEARPQRCAYVLLGPWQYTWRAKPTSARTSSASVLMIRDPSTVTCVTSPRNGRGIPRTGRRGWVAPPATCRLPQCAPHRSAHHVAALAGTGSSRSIAHCCARADWSLVGDERNRNPGQGGEGLLRFTRLRGHPRVADAGARLGCLSSSSRHDGGPLHRTVGAGDENGRAEHRLAGADDAHSHDLASRLHAADGDADLVLLGVGDERSA